MKRSLIFASVFLLTFSAASSWGEEASTSDLQVMKDTFSNVFIARVTSGRIVKNAKGDECFYEYETRISQELKGRRISLIFPFFSESRLSIGDSYLIFFSEGKARSYTPPDATLYVRGHQSEAGKTQNCALRMNGYFLQYEQLNLIKTVEKENKAVEAVEFLDPFLTVSSGIIDAKPERLVELGYIKSLFGK